MLKRKSICKSIIIFASALVLFSSCETTKADPLPSDTYETKVTLQEDDENTQIEEQESESDSESTAVSLPKQEKKAQKNFFSFGNKDDFIHLDGDVTVITREIKGLTEKSADLVIRADTDLAGFGCSVMGAYYIIQMNEASRKQLAKAAQLYFSDFENKNLIRKNKNTVRAYGNIFYQLNWGTLKSSTPSNGKGNGFLGYEFVKNQPYFTISNFAFTNDYYEIAGDATTRESSSLKIYFTRAQLRNLIEILSEENLMQYY